MIRQYHARLVERADAAASSGNAFVALASMRRDAAIWVLPALLAVVLCWIFQLSGMSSLWVSLPLVGVSIVGCSVFVGVNLLSSNAATVSRPLTPQTWPLCFD
jgi:hypothetical protein